MALPPPGDANDFIWQWAASVTYDPEPALGRVQVPVLVINSADDERNPPETGVTERALKAVRDAKVYLIPASSQTRGHGTTGFAAFWAPQLSEFLAGLRGRM